MYNHLIDIDVDGVIMNEDMKKAASHLPRNFVLGAPSGITVEPEKSLTCNACNDHVAEGKSMMIGRQRIALCVYCVQELISKLV